MKTHAMLELAAFMIHTTISEGPVFRLRSGVGAACVLSWCADQTSHCAMEEDHTCFLQVTEVVEARIHI